jgi:DUF971 family protein
MAETIARCGTVLLDTGISCKLAVGHAGLHHHEADPVVTVWGDPIRCAGGMAWEIERMPIAEPGRPGTSQRTGADHAAGRFAAMTDDDAVHDAIHGLRMACGCGDESGPCEHCTAVAERLDRLRAAAADGERLDAGAVAAARYAVVAALYFDDGSDFGTYLWDALKALAPDWYAQSESRLPNAVYESARAARDAAEAALRERPTPTPGPVEAEARADTETPSAEAVRLVIGDYTYDRLRGHWRRVFVRDDSSLLGWTPRIADEEIVALLGALASHAAEVARLRGERDEAKDTVDRMVSATCEDIGLRILAERENASLTRERDAAKENGAMAADCLDMVREVLTVLLGAESMQATPPMMYPEAIRQALYRVAMGQVPDEAYPEGSLHHQLAHLRARCEAAEQRVSDALLKMDSMSEGCRGGDAAAYDRAVFAVCSHLRPILAALGTTGPAADV